MLSPSSSRLRGHLGTGGRNHVRQRDKQECCEMLSSGHHMGVRCMKSKQPWIPELGLQKIQPAQIQHRWRTWSPGATSYWGAIGRWLLENESVATVGVLCSNGSPHPCAFPVDPHILAHLWWIPTSLHISSGSPQSWASPVDAHIHAHLQWLPTSMHISAGSLCPCTSPVDAHIHIYLWCIPTYLHISSTN